MLNILTWNVRGFNRPFKHRDDKRLLFSHKVNILCLLETRVQPSKADVIRNHMFTDWTFYDNYQYSNLGRIWLFHDKLLSISYILILKAFIMRFFLIIPCLHFLPLLFMLLML